jgi:hypothetical protein
MMRRLVAAFVIVVILAAGWVGGWFWLAGWVDRNADPTLQRIAERGIDVECPNRAVVGFPFELRVTCGKTAVAERSTGTTANIAGASGGASVFRPMTAEIALQSPVRVESPLLEGPVELRWTDAAVDIGMGMNGPKTISFDASDLLGAFTIPGLPEQTVAATEAQVRLAPSPSGGSAVALAFTDLAFTDGGTHFPPVTGSAIADLSVPPRVLASGPDGIELPVSAQDIRIQIQSGEARFMMEGDISLGPDGVLDGTLILRIAGAEALPEFIAALPMEFQRIANAATAGLFAFGQPATVDGKQGSEMRMTIVANRVQIGPMLEFDLPRLRL